MKLRQISENFIMQKLRDQLQSSGYFNRPIVRTDQPFMPTSGHDSGSRIAGAISQPTGVPIKPRHRRYLGMEKRLGAIRL